MKMRRRKPTETPVTVQNSIRARVKADYITLTGRGGYRALGLLWGVSSGMAWNLEQKEDYWPKDLEIQRVLEDKARERGILVRRKRRKRVFYL